MSFGFLLPNRTSAELRYFHASPNNTLAFDTPFVVRRRASGGLEAVDVLEKAKQARPDSKWVVDGITNVFFFVHKLGKHPIGCGQELLHYLRNSKGLETLVSNWHGVPYLDNLCFVRCLARHRGFPLNGLERAAKDTLEQFRVARLMDCSPQTFGGVLLANLAEVERVFETNLYVCALEPTEGDKDVLHVDHTTARLIHPSMDLFESTLLYLNWYRDHFSYITDMRKYALSYRCSCCGKFWKKGSRLNRHEKMCAGPSDTLGGLKFGGLGVCRP